MDEGRRARGRGPRAMTFTLRRLDMRYMLLINSDKAAPPPQPAALEGIMRGHQRFAEELQAARKIDHGERLRPDGDATRIPLKAGQPHVTADPFNGTTQAL